MRKQQRWTWFNCLEHVFEIACLVSFTLVMIVVGGIAAMMIGGFLYHVATGRWLSL